MNGPDTLDDLMPSAAPGEAEIDAWNKLSRDGQVRRTRIALAHPDCSTIGTATMDDLRRRRRDRAAKIRNG